TVLDQQQTQVLFADTLDLLLREHYEGKHDYSGELKEVVQSHFNGWDQPLRHFIARLHDFTQTRPAPGQWFAQSFAQLSRESAPEWHALYAHALQDWCAWWIPYLRNLPAENKNAHACAAILEKASLKNDSTVAAQICARDAEEHWARKK